jgi:predicted secreted protein
MPFSLPLAAAIYLTIWWIVLFAVLPLGVRSSEEADEDLPEGADPGAPASPDLLKKAGITTVVSAVLFGLLVLFAKVTA